MYGESGKKRDQDLHAAAIKEKEILSTMTICVQLMQDSITRDILLDHINTQTLAGPACVCA